MQGVNNGEVAAGLLINFIVNYCLFKSMSDSFFKFMGVIFFDLFVKFRIIKLSVAFFFVIFCTENDYSFSFISWFYDAIVIKPADKGKAVVILSTEDYKKECY